MTRSIATPKDDKPLHSLENQFPKSLNHLEFYPHMKFCASFYLISFLSFQFFFPYVVQCFLH